MKSSASEIRLASVVLLVARLVAGEVERPGMDARDVGIAPLAERAQQVERRRRLQVGLQHALGIGGARLGVAAKSLMMSPL
jgi:tetrahydromethanopterin S-methyltransferase subunit F